MYDSVASEQVDSLSARRAVVLALVGVLLLSSVGGVIGSSGIAAAQQTGSGSGTTASNGTANATATPSADSASRGGGASEGIQGGQLADPRNPSASVGDSSAGAAQNPSNNSTSAQPPPDPDDNSDAIQGGQLADPQNPSANASNSSDGIQGGQLADPQNPSANASVGRDGGALPESPNIDIDIPNLMDIKLQSLADSFKKGAADTLGTIYKLAFSTPVPENDGWNGIFGEPTNATGAGQNATNATAADSWGQVLGISSDKTYNQLHQQLLMDKLYPLLNYVLSIGVVVLGLSLTVKPLMSRFRIINLMTKFVTFLFLYAFSWGTITLMHGVVNDITMWFRPTSAELQSLVTSIDKIGAASAAAYFVGSGGILSTVFGMGIELTLRHLALVYFFPYVFPVLVLILYLSPWQRLKSFASMGIWQYVNVLTMVIPMAVFLKAALIVNFSPTDGIGGMIALLALFVFALVVPLVQTYFFIQIPGTAAWAAKSAGSAATSRLSIGGDDDDGDGDDSSADSTATGSASPDDRAESAVETTSAGFGSSNSGLSGSGKLSASQLEKMDPAGSSGTTAGQVRALDDLQHRDPNNADARYKAYFAGREDRPRQTTLDENATG